MDDREIRVRCVEFALKTPGVRGQALTEKAEEYYKWIVSNPGSPQGSGDALSSGEPPKRGPGRPPGKTGRKAA